MTTQTEVLKIALEAMQQVHGDYHGMPNRVGPKEAFELMRKAITAVIKALAQPERHELQAEGKHPAPCARFCEANAFQIEIRRLKAQLAQPEQEPVVGTKTWFEDGKVVTQHLTAKDIYKDPEHPEQEPVAWMFQHEETGRTMCVDAQQLEWGFEKGNPRLKKIAPLYTTPPQRTWVGLTDKERKEIERQSVYVEGAMRMTEAKLKEKNTHE